MSIKTDAQFCAICEREKQQPNGISNKTSAESNSKSPSERGTYSQRHKYGNLPAKKHDDFFTQVTEPQWLRRGNLKESDLVCKRHLAVLMRGVDRGCEGGCCSPLHRGARICKPRTLKSIPPTWRKRFVMHPKIKEEDKSLMLLCWECYKKHMDRMSKYGNPMGRSFGNRHGLERSNSLVDAESGTSILQYMKRYKSMDKLDSWEISISPEHGSSSRRMSSKSISPRPAGQEITRDSPEAHPDTETKSSSSRRSARGRKINKGRRSPSPPNNISPVRTSVVHSRRKHSPHKGSKSPITHHSEITSKMSLVAHSSPDLVLSTWTANVSSQSHAVKIENDTLPITESPHPAPVPPFGLFSPRNDRSDDVIDVFGTRNSTSAKRSASGPPKPPHVKIDLVKVSPIPLPRHANAIQTAEARTKEEVPVDNTEMTQVGRSPVLENIDSDDGTNVTIDDIRMVDTNSTPIQAEESITSADEMAGIFEDDDTKPITEFNRADRFSPAHSDHTGDIEVLLEVNHKHDSSGSSSDKTGDTQIAVGPSPDSRMLQENGYDAEENMADEVNERNYEVIINDEKEPDDFENGEISPNEMSANFPETVRSPGQHPETAFLTSDIKDSVFLSPVRRKDPKGSSPTLPSSVLNYSLSPQSFRRLESIRLSFTEETIEDDEFQNSNFKGRSDVRDFSHPLRNHVMLKVPKGSRLNNSRSSFVRVAAEDVELYPDTMSFLEGITQTIGEDMSMYSKDDLQLVKVNLRKEENREVHKTALFASDLLVVRRGQAFEIELELNENYEGRDHNIVLELLTGVHPRVSNGTHIFLPVQSHEFVTAKYDLSQGSTWSARFMKSNEKVLTLSVTSPPTCPIGSYFVYFQIEKDGRRSRWNAGAEDDRSLIVLFNPWCIDDSVFMSSQSDRQEYVSSDTGCVYTGNRSNLFTLPWIFGQYEEDVLHACLELLESCNLTNSKLGDPVSVTEAISRLVSDSITHECTNKMAGKQADDILASSADILRQYSDTGILRVPNSNVIYSTLLVTVFRCFGFPTRPVTCLDCAVETDLPMAVNIHYSGDGQMLDYLNSDLIWPSYNWTDVWMSRVDLPPGFGGWQATLSSPIHKESVGPTPVYAIKKGQTSCCPGTRMHFMALNADKKHWIVSQDGSMELIKTDKNRAGSQLVTKSAGSLSPQDITKLYKFQAGSEEIKLALHAAHMHCGRQDVYDENQNADDEVIISLSTLPDVINFGNDVDVITRVTNNGHSVRHLTININGAVLAQDGSPLFKLPRETILAEVLKGESVEIPVKVNLLPCLHKLSHGRHLSFVACATVRENPECRLLSSCITGIKYPDVEIQLHGEFKVGGEVTVAARVRNPLSYVLRNARLLLATSGLTPLNISSKSGKSVGPWSIFKCERIFRCHRAGKHTIVAYFASDHMSGPVGTQEFDITNDDVI